MTLLTSVLLLQACSWSRPLRSEPQPVAATPVVLDAGGLLTPAESEEAVQDAVENAADRQRAESMVAAIQEVAHTPLVAGNEVQLLVDGPNTYAAMLAAMAGAQHSIHVETYIFSDDEIGQRFAELLVRKRHEGVDVRVIYDAVGSIGSAAKFFKDMQAQGIEVAEFQPLESVAIWRINNRDHRKLVIVDGLIAFAGGLNISGAYSVGSGSRPGPEKGLDAGWRDTHVEVRGPAVKLLQTIFLDTWKRLGKDVTTGMAQLFPPQEERGPHLVQVVASGGGDSNEFRIYDAYMTAIRRAQRRIWITQAYFAPNEELRVALIDAVKRGVDVRVLVPGFTDSGLIFHASRATYAELLQGGVQLYELTDALLHSKAAVVDGIWSTVGSCNIDARSFAHNNEINVAVVGVQFARSMERRFSSDLQRSHRIDPEEWRHRPLGVRLKEFFSSLFGYWL